MKKYLFLINIVLLLVSCGKSPNSEEKNPFSEEMQVRKIKKIDVLDLLTFANEEGKVIVQKLNSDGEKSIFIDSLQKQGVIVKFLDSASVIGASKFEQKIMKAYLQTTDLTQLSDNVKEISKGTFILYNAPIVKENKFEGMYSIFFKKGVLVKHLHQSGKF